MNDDIFEDIPYDTEEYLYRKLYEHIILNVKDKNERMIWKRAISWIFEQEIYYLIKNDYIEIGINDEINISLTAKLYNKFKCECSSAD